MTDISALIAGQPSVREFITSVNPALANLRTGDSISAEVIPDGENGAALLLPDGTQVSVAAAAGQELPFGEILRLTVTGRMAGSVMMEVSQGGTPSADTQALGTKLRALNIENTPVNMKIADVLQNSGAQLTKETVTQLAEILKANPTLTPEKAAFMLQSKIPVTQRNIASFDAFSRRESIIGSTLEKLMDILQPQPKAVPYAAQPEAVSSAAAGDTAPNVAQQQNTTVAQTPTPPAAQAPLQGGELPPAIQTQQAPVGDADHSVPQQPEAVSSVAAGDTTPNMPQPQTPTVAQAPRPPVGDATHSVPQQSDTPTPVATTDTQQPVAVTVNLVSQQQRAEAAQTQQSKAVPSAPAGDTTPKVTQPQTTAIEQTPQAPVGDVANSVPQQTTPPAAQAPLQGGELPSVPPPQTNAPSPQTQQQDDLLTKVGNLFRKIDRSRANILHRELDAPKLMRELSDVLKALTDKAETMTGTARQELTQVTRELETSLKFMGELNNFTAFVQLPLNINGDRSTADLYVFNDGKDKKKIDPENATLFLSLGTVNAGRIETFVKVIGKNIECDFSLETEDAAKLLRREMPVLLKLLDAQGFRLQRTSSGVHPEPAEVTEINEQHKKLASKYKFNTVV